LTASTLQNLFSVYCVLAVGYNFVSLLLQALKGKRAAPTEPQNGVLFIAVMYLVFIVGTHYPGWLNIFFLSCLTVLTIQSGIFRHVLGYSQELYFSRITWAAAFTINTFGAGVLILIILTWLGRN
jgi:hypothetical protein